MTLRLPDDWLWDSWFVVDGDRVHAFFLCAPRALGDPDRRHWNARIGHATTRDLQHWDLRPDALWPGPPGAFDDLATWTGSVVRDGARWLMAYTGVARADAGRVQRIGFAESHDLDTWRRLDGVVGADPRWYETSVEGSEEHWRDPWAWLAPDGTLHLLVTARANHGPVDGRGVIGHAWSRDRSTWEVGRPLSVPGELRELEVPQLVRLAPDRWVVLFSAWRPDHSAARLARPGVVRETGTHWLRGPSPFGPFEVAPGPFLLGGPAEHLYAGRHVEWQGRHWLMAWIHTDGGRFIGELADPIPLEIGADGTLELANGREGILR